jgi:hypothetical protein
LTRRRSSWSTILGMPEHLRRARRRVNLRGLQSLARSR